MEFMAFKLYMDYMITYGLTISTFISDRHSSIAKYMRTAVKNIVHYFDLWHLKKSKSTIVLLPKTYYLVKVVHINMNIYLSL